MLPPSAQIHKNKNIIKYQKTIKGITFIFLYS